jgi:hypothetical protein
VAPKETRYYDRKYKYIYIRWGLVNFAAQGFLEIIPGTCKYFMPATLLRGLVNFSAQGFLEIIAETCKFFSSGIYRIIAGTCNYFMLATLLLGNLFHGQADEWQQRERMM